jgi:hypothetical protein
LIGQVLQREHTDNTADRLTMVGETASSFSEAAQLLERAVRCRYRSVREFERATHIQHTMFAAMRRGILPGLRTLTALCRGLDITFASVLAACWGLDLNKLPELHLLSTPTGTTILPSSAAHTGLVVPFCRLSALAAPHQILSLTELVKGFDEQPLTSIESLTQFRYLTVRLGDWSLAPLFQPGDFLFVEPTTPGGERLRTLCTLPRPIVLVRQANGYALGHLAENSARATFTLEPHPESGCPRLELKGNDWELVGVVRGYTASLVEGAKSPGPWVPPALNRSHLRLVAGSPFGTLARDARLRLGLSVLEVVRAIEQLTEYLPGSRDLYLLSKTRIHNIERKRQDSKLNVFGLFALLAVYGLDYREATNALGYPINERDSIPLQQLLGFTVPPEQLLIDRHPWFKTAALTWGTIPWQMFALYPQWTKQNILYHGPKLPHPMVASHSFLRVDKCEDLPTRPLRGVPQGLRWPLFVLAMHEGMICSNAYRTRKQVHLIQHPLLPPVNGTFHLGSNVDLVGKVTGIASILPSSFGWN